MKRWNYAVARFQRSDATRTNNGRMVLRAGRSQPSRPPCPCRVQRRTADRTPDRSAIRPQRTPGSRTSRLPRGGCTLTPGCPDRVLLPPPKSSSRQTSKPAKTLAQTGSKNGKSAPLLSYTFSRIHLYPKKTATGRPANPLKHWLKRATGAANPHHCLVMRFCRYNNNPPKTLFFKGAATRHAALHDRTHICRHNLK